MGAFERLSPCQQARRFAWCYCTGQKICVVLFWRLVRLNCAFDPTQILGADVLVQPPGRQADPNCINALSVARHRSDKELYFAARLACSTHYATATSALWR